MNPVILQLQKLITINKLPHAFILTGKDIDLTAEGRAFSKWVLCSNATSTHACETCRVCQLLQANTSPDFMLIEPIISGNSKTIKIEQIRELIAFVQMKPQFSAKKIILLCGAEYLNVQAANALLRTLEEPPLDIHIILTIENPKLLLETIISRCPVFNLGTVAKQVLQHPPLADTILLDLYNALVLHEVNLITTIEQWMHQEANELLTCCWFVVIALIHYKFATSCNYIDLNQEKVAKISKTQSLQQLWSILDKILAIRKDLLLGRQVNIQLFLENIMITWQQGINNGR